MNYDNPKTLRHYKPKLNIYGNSSSPFATYCEYNGYRYFDAHHVNGWVAESVAHDRHSQYPNASWFVADRYDSTHIDGDAKDFRNHYAKEKLA
tara:strand:- start:347 stop:625 length:279 start_codon:yes stop_codon:yes gene_type:complete